VRGIASASGPPKPDSEAHTSYCLAVTQSGSVFRWGCPLLPEEDDLIPIIVQGFGEGVRLRSVHARLSMAFAFCEKGGLFS
jgi:hypothetical protein